MKKLAARLKAEGYTVWNEGYPSIEKPIDELVTDHVVPAVQWAEAMRLKKFISSPIPWGDSRPGVPSAGLPSGRKPNRDARPSKQGEPVADRLKSFFLYKRFMGPAGQQLGTGPASVPNNLEPVTAHIGIIAGTRSKEPWFSLILPGPDDGKVSVESTKLSEMNDFLKVKSSHPFIMRSPEVVDQAVFYLQNGWFSHLHLRTLDS